MSASRLLLAILMLISTAEGTVSLSLTQVLSALDMADAPVSEMITRIVIDLRLPRTLLAVMTGLAWPSSGHCCKPPPVTI